MDTEAAQSGTQSQQTIVFIYLACRAFQRISCGIDSLCLSSNQEFYSEYQWNWLLFGAPDKIVGEGGLGFGQMFT